jgi:ribonuclease D
VSQGTGSGPLVVTSAEELQELIERLLASDRYALDTEFHRERTYWPRLALIQVAWPASGDGQAGVAIVDPLVVDPAPLARVFNGPGTMVAHAAEQDLEVLDRACGTRPGVLFDTQVAAGFLGSGSASLGSLTEQFIGIRLTKGDRLTDWSRRPLTPSQLSYAASDVAHLLELAGRLGDDLRAVGRLAWVEEECASLLQRPSGPGRPERAWWRIRESRQLRGPARGVAQELMAWREAEARELDLPPRMVLPDLAAQAIVHSQPATPEALRQVRGLDGRSLRRGASEGILAAVARGQELPRDAIEVPPAEEVPKDLRPAVALAAAWVAQLARDERIDAALLATRSDLVSFLRGDPAARLRQGWRHQLVGEPVRRLTEGEAALAFDGRGGLVLEPRWSGPAAAV